MLDALNAFFLSIADPLLGWMLRLPRWGVLFAVAIGTALILTVVRVFTTNQGLLRRCKQDKARLKELIRAAKKQRDKDALKRHRAVMGKIGMKTMRAEGKPLLAAIIPIVLLATWAFSRIAYLPPQEGQAVTVNAYTGIPRIGRLVHMIPQDGIEAETGWIQRVQEDVLDDQVTNGIARWQLRCRKRDEPYVLKVRFMGEIFEKELIVDGLYYTAPLQTYEGGAIQVIETALPEYKLFGVVPGYGWFQPWVVGYLIIVLPFAFLLKPILRIY